MSCYGFWKGGGHFLKFYNCCGSDRVEEVRRSGADGYLCGCAGLRESGGTGANRFRKENK